MPPLRGRMRRRCCHSSDITLFRQSGMPWVPFTKRQKKGGSLIPPRTTHRPLTEGNTTKVMEEIPTSRRHYDQTTTGVSNPRKSRGPTLCSLAAFTPCWGDLMFARAHHLRHRHKRPLRRGALRPPEGRGDLVTASAISDLIPGLRRGRAPRHERNYRFLYL